MRFRGAKAENSLIQLLQAPIPVAERRAPIRNIGEPSSSIFILTMKRFKEDLQPVDLTAGYGCEDLYRASPLDLHQKVKGIRGHAQSGADHLWFAGFQPEYPFSYYGRAIYTFHRSLPVNRYCVRRAGHHRFLWPEKPLWHFCFAGLSLEDQPGRAFEMMPASISDSEAASGLWRDGQPGHRE